MLRLLMPGPRTTSRTDENPGTSRMHFKLKGSKTMKTQTRATKKTQPLFVPIASFEFESFNLPVRRVKSHGLLPIGAVLRKLNVCPQSSEIKFTHAPLSGAESAKIFLPSPSPQGPGRMCLRLGARLVSRPTALPSYVNRRFDSYSRRSAKAQTRRLLLSGPNK